ncbi:MAG: hypothetical protein DRJ64_02980 [Thermoprotei archaeon]|nr:MAG: hypothetical protein DRJ64_02980 [Thermoprotei archaeon]
MEIRLPLLNFYEDFEMLKRILKQMGFEEIKSFPNEFIRKNYEGRFHLQISVSPDLNEFIVSLHYDEILKNHRTVFNPHISSLLSQLEKVYLQCFRLNLSQL